MSNVRFPNKVKFQKDKQLAKAMGRQMAEVAEKVCLALSVAILADVFDFEDDEVTKFIDSYSTLAESLGVGTDDLDTITKRIEERFSVNISQNKEN